jgi:DNA-binding MarR family transcriptional regulator
MNTIEQSGILGIATRLQRLSDQIRKEGFLVFKENGVDFEPKWFPIVYTLHLRPGLSVVELATEIGYAHPSTITLLKELEAARLITSKKHKTDERKRLLQLSKKGVILIDQMKPVWDILINVVAEIIDTENNLMKAIVEVENKLKEKSFFERSKRYMPPSSNKLQGT